MAPARATALLVAAAVLASGCEDEQRQAPPATATPAATSGEQPPATTRAKQPPATGQVDRDRKRLHQKYGPGYVPSAYHAGRPAGYTYPDEVGENVLIAPYRRIIEVFGPPASRDGRCIDYRIVRSPRERWEFCFRGQKMTSAMVIRPGP
jgi:hypothetical protein